MFNFQGYLPFVLEGAIIIVELALLSLVVALLLGMVGASAKLSKSRLASGIAHTYTTLIRGVPELVLLVLLFYGGQIILNNITDYFGLGYTDVNPFGTAVVVLGLIYGAYMTETFRGAILAVPKGEIEAGVAYGMSRFQVFRRVTFPAMMRHALPGLGNVWQVLVKATALASTIGMQDMVFRAGQAGGATREPFTFLLVVAVVYLLITAVSNGVLSYLEKRFSVGVRHAH